MVNIFGDRGMVGGDKGPRGAIGPGGREGPVGPKGERGKEGEQGKEGGRGPQGVRGRVGKRGEDGTSGIVDLYNWLPHTMLNNFQVDSEEGCFLITKGGKDVEIKDRNIVKWKSRSFVGTFGSHMRTRKDAVISGEPCNKIEYLPDDRGFLGLQKSIFTVDNVCLTNAYSFVCITFKLLGDDPDQYIVSNWESDAQGRVFRGVSASKKEIRIHGCAGKEDYIAIKHNTEVWTTLFIEWSLNGGTFNINSGEQEGSFAVEPPSIVLPPCVYIGARSDSTHYFDGYISAVEWCSFIEADDDHFPNTLKKLLMKDQYIYDVVIEPPVKKTKRNQSNDTV